MKRFLFLYFMLLAITVIILMICDNAERPYDAGSGWGNSRNGVYVNPLFVLLEFFLILLSIRQLAGQQGILSKVATVLAWFCLAGILLINSMHAGGIFAIHVLWLLVVSFSLLGVFITKCIRPGLFK